MFYDRCLNNIYYKSLSILIELYNDSRKAKFIPNHMHSLVSLWKNHCPYDKYLYNVKYNAIFLISIVIVYSVKIVTYITCIHLSCLYCVFGIIINAINL